VRHGAESTKGFARATVCDKSGAGALEAVFEELPPAAAKTGLLYSTGIIREVARFLKGAGRVRWWWIR